MRHRLEDLGRILVLLEEMSVHGVFDIVKARPKDFWGKFESMSQEEREEIIDKFAYGLEELEEKISEIILIARGHDELNQRVDE